AAIRPGKSKPSIESTQKKELRKRRTIAGRTIVAPSPRKHKVWLAASALFRSTIRLSGRSRCLRLLAGLPHAARRSNRGRKNAAPSVRSGAEWRTIRILQERRDRWLPQSHSGRQSHEKDCERKQLPITVLALQTHVDLASAGAGGVCYLAKFQRQECNVIVDFRAADLHLYRASRRLAANDRSAGRVCRNCGFARL